MVIDGDQMTHRETKKMTNLEKENIEDFAKYLGVDCEDLYEFTYRRSYVEEIDFDDYSR